MLEVKKLTKIYLVNKKKSVGCEDISFTAEQGDVISLLGLNGAGKSSILNMLSMYLYPTSGDAFIGGLSIITDKLKAKEQIGVLHEKNPLYEKMTVKQFLYFCEGMHGIDRNKSNIDEICEFWDIRNMKNQKISSLSKGFKQRVGLAGCMIHKPKLLILDEPTDGLDAIQRKEFEKKILDLRDEMTIIISTHDLIQAEHICTKHILLNDGKIVNQGALQDLKKEVNNIKKASNNVTTEHTDWIKDNHSILENAFYTFANIDPMKFKRHIYE